MTIKGRTTKDSVIMVSMHKQILPTRCIKNIWSTERGINMSILELKGLWGSWRFLKSHQPKDFHSIHGFFKLCRFFDCHWNNLRKTKIDNNDMMYGKAASLCLFTRTNSSQLLIYFAGYEMKTILYTIHYLTCEYNRLSSFLLLGQKSQRDCSARWIRLYSFSQTL